MFHRKIASKCNVTRHLGSIWKRARNRQPFSCTHAWSCWSARRGDVCIWSMLSGEREKCLKSTFLRFEKCIWRRALIRIFFTRRWSELLKVQGGLGCIWSMQESWERGGWLPSDVQGYQGLHVLGLCKEWMKTQSSSSRVAKCFRRFDQKFYINCRKLGSPDRFFFTYDTSMGILTFVWDWTVCKWCNVLSVQKMQMM